jgi:PAS domain S-box-containing protein
MKYKLQDLIDIKQFQSLQDKLNEIYSFPSAIIDIDGNILTATAWQDVCTKFHRADPESEKECKISDQYISGHINEANPAVSYKCPHGLVDNAMPILIEGEHYGNFFTGQFFLEEPDLEFFKKQAKRYGFDEESFLTAVKKVPVWNKEQLNSYLLFIKEMINVISAIGLKNLREIETSRKIKESEEEFRSIFEYSPTGMLMLGLDGKFLKVNKAFCEMLGYSESELLTYNFSDITFVDDSIESNNWIDKLINSEVQTSDFEKRYITKSKNILWVHIRALLKRDSNGNPLYFVSHIQDINELKLKEEELKASYSMYHNLVETAQDLIWQCDAEGRYVYLNHAWETVFGYKVEEMLGKKFSDFQTKEWAERDLKEFARLLKGNTVKALETVHLGKNGNEINLVFNAKIATDTDGKISGTHGTAFNISDYKKIVQSFNESEAKYRSLFENISNSFALHKIVLDDKGVPVDYIFKEVNQAFEKQTGQDRNSIIGKKVTEVFPGIENDPFDWIGKYGKVALSGEEIRFDQYFQQLDKWYSILAYSNKKEHFATIFTDITEQVKVHEKVKESELRFRSIIENTEAGYFFLDKDGFFRDVNNAWVKLYKYDSADEVIGKYFTDVQQIDDLVAAKAFVEGIMQGNKNFMNGEFSRLCKDGSTGYHSFSSRPVIEENIVIGIEGFLVDITNLKKTQEELNEYKTNLESLVQERTNELEKAKNDLESKNSELIRFNKLFAGREMRIKELKDRISELENKNVKNKSDDQY